MLKVKSEEQPYFFKKFKTYNAEDILAAGGTTAFGKSKIIGLEPSLQILSAVL